MRRLASVLGILLATLAGQVAVFWAAVALAQSPAMDRFDDLGPGSVGEGVVLLGLIVAFDAVLVGALALALGRHRREPPRPR